jgi:hypothetical protein
MGLFSRLFAGSANTSPRERARKLSDDGVRAANARNVANAKEAWREAIGADPTWSVPYFNIAKLALDAKDMNEAEQYLLLAEEVAKHRQSTEDAQVLQGIKAGKLRLMLGKPGAARDTKSSPQGSKVAVGQFQIVTGDHVHSSAIKLGLIQPEWGVALILPQAGVDCRGSIDVSGVVSCQHCRNPLPFNAGLIWGFFGGGGEATCKNCNVDVSVGGMEHKDSGQSCIYLFAHPFSQQPNRALHRTIPTVQDIMAESTRHE